MDRFGIVFAVVFFASVFTGCDENIPASEFDEVVGPAIMEKAVRPVSEKTNSAETDSGAELDVPQWAKEIIRKLSRQKCTVNFDDAELSEVFEYVRRVGGFNLVVAPEALKDVEGNVKTLTLSVKNMSLGNFVNWVCRLSRLDFELRDSALYITPAGSADGRKVTQIYDVRDLSLPLRHFVAPELNLDNFIQEAP